jgi:hypothetical protein
MVTIMAEYIERANLLGAMENLCNRVCDYSPAQRHFMCGSCQLGSALKLVEEFSNADVQPVKHGQWLLDNPKYLLSHCSECKCFNSIGHKWKYCPDCGARMDGEA